MSVERFYNIENIGDKLQEKCYRMIQKKTKLKIKK